MSDSIVAPWTTEQVSALNDFQDSGVMHPFTCPRPHTASMELVATPDGWVCPFLSCDYTQNWAHAAMVSPAFLERMKCDD